MPLRASALAADRKPLQIVFDQGDLNLVYKPSAINAAQEEREIADKATGRTIMAYINSLVETVTSWDLLDDDGQPLPITKEALAPFGFGVVRHIFDEIIRDSLPNQKTRSTSSDGSPGAGSAAAPTGTPSS